MCDNCPFTTSGRGAALRRSLRPGRMIEIKTAVLRGAPFYCHKSVDDECFDDEGEYQASGNERLCAGALRFLRRTLKRGR